MKRSRRTAAAQALGRVEPETRSLSPAIYPATTYERAADGSYPGGASYTRDENPTYDQVEAVLAELEGGAEALLFSSGMAAATTFFDSLERGTRVLAPDRMYWSLRAWLEGADQRRDLELQLVPAGDLAALESALRDRAAGAVWLETPANPTCEITDLEAASAIAHRYGAVVAVDSTLATPVHTRPLELGCDLVCHSATKQLNGHGDVLAGVLVTADPGQALWQRVRKDRGTRGNVLGPFEAWLLQRGLRTLFLRVELAAANALEVARLLAAHDAVAEVFYPGLPDHPGHGVARRQMERGFGCLLSFRVAAGEAAARQVANRLEVFKQATSLGGVESLVEHRASIEGPGTQAPPDLLRLSIGIEEIEDLLADLEAALP